MNKEILEMINLYADGELDRKEEASLFVLLLQEEEARNYFRSLQIMKTGIAQSVEEVPDKLEEKIVKSVTDRQTLKTSFSSVRTFTSKIPYAFTAILLILCMYIFLKFDSYQAKLEVISNQLQNQNKTIEMLYNSLPAAEVTGQLKNKIIVTSKL
jgi:hypothetical protein